MKIPKTIDIGGVHLDPLKLIDTRMLVCANSGGGKSRAIRCLVEKVIAAIPTIILDREGEFSTLREKFDVVIVGAGGEVPTSVATAAKLARKLIELRVSAVIDLSDLRKPDKRRFVRLFLESLLALPRSLWGPTLVVIDEAHEFASEAGSDCESRQAVIALMDQGRKRGFGGILATQRLSKLAKDAAGEANNLMIGRFAQDVDLARASSLLGFAGKSEWPTMRDSKPGEFYAVGPAFEHTGVVRFRSGPIVTTHPSPGQRAYLEPPAPSKRIRSVVGELADLQTQVEAEASELENLRAEVARLRKGKVPGPSAADLAAARDEGAAAAGRAHRERMQGIFVDIGRLFSADVAFASSVRSALAVAPAPRTRVRPVARPAIADASAQAVGYDGVIKAQMEAISAHQARRSRSIAEPGGARVGNGAKKYVLTALAQHGARTRRELGLLTCLVSTAGSFGNVLGELRSAGWTVDLGDGRLEITEAGRDALGRAYSPLPMPGVPLLEAWAAKFGGGTVRMFWAIAEAGAQGITRADLGAAVDMQHTAGSFGNNLGAMRGQGVMIDIGKGPGRRFAIDPLVRGDGA